MKKRIALLAVLMLLAFAGFAHASNHHGHCAASDPA